MELEVKKTVRYTLHLTPQEAYDLKALAQNGKPDEDANDKSIRQKVFEELPDFHIIAGNI